MLYLNTYACHGLTVTTLLVPTLRFIYHNTTTTHFQLLSLSYVPHFTMQLSPQPFLPRSEPAQSQPRTLNLIFYITEMLYHSFAFVWRGVCVCVCVCVCARVCVCEKERERESICCLLCYMFHWPHVSVALECSFALSYPCCCVLLFVSPANLRNTTILFMIT